MALLTWLIVGVAAGLIAKVALGGVGYGILGDIAVGIVGAVLGGWLFHHLDATGVIFLALVAAVALLLVLRAMRPIRLVYGSDAAGPGPAAGRRK